MCRKELLGLNFTRKYVDLPMFGIYSSECIAVWRLNKQDNKIGKELKTDINSVCRSIVVVHVAAAL